MHKEPTRHKYIARLVPRCRPLRKLISSHVRCLWGAGDVTSETSEWPDDVIERSMHVRMPERRDDVTLKNR